jgi:hypothetical protein
MSTTKSDIDTSIPPTHLQAQEVEANHVQRRGAEVAGQEELDQIKLEYDELPLNWPASKKWTITILVAFISGTVTFASSVHASAVGMFNLYILRTL